MSAMLYETEIFKFSSLIYTNTDNIKILMRTRRYLDSNYFNDINLDILSEGQGLSKYYLLHFFKFFYGKTPKQYLIDKRIEKSKENLLNGMSVYETCYDVGFYSPSNFFKLFKRNTGLTPLKFKNTQC
tara:strand:+ start:800 stop:1183 length:384 start_codon:yes stop_codon:yes gene_type:complete